MLLAVVVLLGLGVAHVIRGAPLQVVVAHEDPAGPPAVSDPRFLATVAALSETPVIPSNAVALLTNGDETFPRLFADLRGARRSITVQAYYGKAAGRPVFSILLSARGRASSSTMFDAFTDAPGPFERALHEAGVHVAAFRPFRWWELDRVSHRAHTRAIVVDGRIGYTGGFGLDDKWLGDGRRRGQWRDTNVRFTGPAVLQLQAAFAEMGGATGELVAHRLFRDVGTDAGTQVAEPRVLVTSGQRAGALDQAPGERSTSRSYSSPASFRRLLAQAAGRGADVRVLTNSRETDVSLTRLAGRSYYAELLEAGVRIYEYQPTMMHAKTLVADGVWAIIGTLNFDNRSLALNNEVSLLVLDRRLGAAMDSLFLADLRYAREIDLAGFRGRPWHERLREWGASQLARVL
jgi:cardiolipin synthase